MEMKPRRHRDTERKRLREVALILPLCAFLLLSFFALRRGNSSTWHTQCAELARRGDWKGLIALQTNLEQLGKTDTEALFWAVYSANTLEDKQASERYATLLLDRKYLNPALDRQLQMLFKDADLQQRISLHRAVGTQIISGLLLGLVAFAVLYRKNVYPWLAGLSALGCLLLLL